MRRTRPSKHSVHYQRVHEPQNRVLEALRNRSDKVESQVTPKLYRAFVGTDHTVELHGSKASSSRTPQRVLAHRRCNAPADRVRRGHITAVGDVGTAAPLIRVQIIGSGHQFVRLCDEYLVIGGKPVCQRVGSAPVTWQRIGFACPQYGFDYAPNGVGVCKCGSANSQQG
jgi:hypothetical protein